MSTSCVDSPVRNRLYESPTADPTNGARLDWEINEEESPISSSMSVPSKSSEGSVGSVDRDNTAFLFDWDDTLLASSWLAQRGLRLDSVGPLPLEAQQQLALLEQSVIKILRRALEFGPVHVITNAEHGWVELSARKFLPGTLEVLSCVRIVSARTCYEKDFPNQPKEWKVAAFRSELDCRFGSRMMLDCDNLKQQQLPLNIVSFGDSIHEREALLVVSKELQGARAKSVKFVERPTIEQLQRQLELVHGYMDHINTYEGHLDLMLTVQLLYS